MGIVKANTLLSSLPAIMLLSPSIGVCASRTNTVFGPTQYVRTTGRPQAFVDSFDHCGTAACKLIVINGSPDGTNRISSASILLNGVQVIDPNEFNHQVTNIRKPVVLKDKNQLTTRLASKPGGFLTLKVKCAASPVVLSAGPPGVSLLDGSTLLSAVPIINGGAVAAQNVRVTMVTLNGGQVISPELLPLSLGDIPAKGEAVLNAEFVAASFIPGQKYALTVEGTYVVDDTIFCFAIGSELIPPPLAPGSAPLLSGEVSAQSVTGAPFSPEEIEEIGEGINETGPPVPVGPLRGTVSPTTPLLNVHEPRALRAIRRSRARLASTSAGGTSRAAENDVVFVHNTSFGTRGGSPNDPSGASGGLSRDVPAVVLTTGNTYGSLSTDGGSAFRNLNPTTIFPNRDAAGNLIDGGLCCDQVVHYSAGIDRFLWLMQFRSGPTGASRLRLAAASPEALVNTNGTAWTYWDLTSSLFNLGDIQLDYPDLSVGDNFLYVSVDGNGGLLVARIPLTELRDGVTIHIAFTDPANATSAYGVHLIQNPGDEIFWAGHPSNSTLRVFSLQEGSNTYFWRDIDINSYPVGDYSSISPDGTDWLASLFSGGPGGIRTFSYDTSGSVRDEVWFEWMGGRGGNYPQPHIQVVRLDRSNFSVIAQSQIWNPDFAFGYASFTTNANGQAGMSLAFGGGGYYGTAAFGIFGDNIVYYPCLSTANAFRYGDYTTVRQAYPNYLLYSGTGYCTGATGFEPRYVLFGRSGDVNPSPIP